MGFAVPYLDLFAKLGVLNTHLQTFITAYYHRKKGQPVQLRDPNFFDFMSLEPLKKAEELFYEVGLTGPECMKALKHAMGNVERLGRFIAMYIYSTVLGDENLLTNQELAETIRIDNLHFDPEKMQIGRASCRERV